MEFKLGNEQDPARIKVVGIGGAGGNAVNRMIENEVSGVEFITINTDGLALNHSKAQHRIHIGEKETKGLGAGADPEIGESAAIESKETIKQHLQGANMIFLTAGMGGGTGTGASPIVAEIAQELGILTVAIVTKPFAFEGIVRSRNAERGLAKLVNKVDTIIVIPNQKLLEVLDKKIQFKEAFKQADEILMSATKGISDIILKHGEIQIDFADVKAVMTQGGLAIMGSGSGTGNNRASEALMKAVQSPLLDDISLEGASGVLVNITSGEDLQMEEVEKIMEYIYQAVGVDNESNIIFGTMVEKNMEDEIRVTVVATGFDKERNQTSNEDSEGLRSFSTPKKMVTPSYQYSEPNSSNQPSSPLGEANTSEKSMFDDIETPAYLRFKKRKPWS